MIFKRANGVAIILLAGLCGGAAEIAWVALYSAATGAEGWEVARQVTASVLPGASRSALAPAAGLAIHMLLAIVLAAAFAVAWWRFAPRPMRLESVVITALAALGGVWAVNFYILLPAWNPGFLALLPLSVTLISKLLFGLAMGIVIGDAARGGAVRPA